jgi:predicted metalloprotease with PDZ domain
MQKRLSIFGLFFLFVFSATYTSAQVKKPVMRYIVSMEQAATHYYHVELHAAGWDKDTLQLKMPRWMPGFYRIMNYGKSVEHMSGHDNNWKDIYLKRLDSSTWIVGGVKNKSFVLTYDIKTSRQFVGISYADSAHAYLIPENTFLYVDGYLNIPVSVKIIAKPGWKIATGLESVKGKPDEFTASDLDILYDCPILAGNLEELPSFKVNGIEHRFIGYDMGSFDRVLFMNRLKKMVEAGSAIIGEIPYKQYTFLAIGHGRGGIEHLNNTTVSFDGSEMDSAAGVNRTMSFLAHEYFHNYNVKRIRPMELGPFDYDKGSKTNLLWVSEGLSVYYEYLIIKRAGLISDSTLLANFERDLNAIQNNPGRLYQSLTQSSYNTWHDGPFGRGEDSGRTISYYEKGPVVGLLLDFAIRHATQNKKSLDDVMRLLYSKYYKKMQRGFTDAEFQQACETVAGIPLTRVFEYVYTTTEPDYSTYLSYAGIKVDLQESPTDSKKKLWKLVKMEKMADMQAAIFKSWMGE